MSGKGFSIPQVSNVEAERLACAIFPTRSVKVLSAIVTGLYAYSMEGNVGKLGDWIGSIETTLIHRRADRNVAADTSAWDQVREGRDREGRDRLRRESES